MAFYQDDPSRLTRVRWYFVPEDAPALAMNTVFMSQTWFLHEEQPVLGERIAPRPYFRGGPPPVHMTPPYGRCGTAAQWLDGCLTTDPPVPIDPNTGQARCCRAAVIGYGGDADGGKALSSVWLPICGGSLWSPWLRATLSGFPGCVCLNGKQFYLQWNGVDRWSAITEVHSCAGWTAAEAYVRIDPITLRTYYGDGIGNEPQCNVFCAIHFLLSNAIFDPPYCHDAGVNVYHAAFSEVVIDLIRGRGGDADGGTARAELLELDVGGDADGGTAVITQGETGQGGDADGGTADLGPHVAGLGGDADGGIADLEPGWVSFGGDADGGAVGILPVTYGDGGDADGGIADKANAFTTVGGDADGGTADVS